MIKNRTNPWEDRYGIEINDLLALTEIVEDFPEFSKSLKSYLKYHPTDRDLQKLQIACFGESTWSLAANKFYRQNQQTVERLNQYSTVATFRKKYYDREGNPKSNPMEPFNIMGFYNYLLTNSDKKDEIRENLERMKNLGIRNIRLDHYQGEDTRPTVSKSLVVRTLTEPLTLPALDQIPSAFYHPAYRK